MSLSPDLFGALCFAGGCASFALFIYARGERRRECTSPRPKKTFERFSSSPSMAELLWISFAGLSLAGVVASRSVGTFVAVGAAFSVFLLWSAQRHSRKYAIGILMLLLIVGGAGFGLVLYLRGSDALMHSLHERWLNWGVATRILLENPQGVGLDRFAAAYLEWRTPEGNVTRYAHSMWMQGAAELGVAFVLLSVAGLFGVVKQFRALLSKTFAPAALLLAGVLGWTLRASLDYDFQIAQTSTGWATLAGLALFWAPTFVAKGSSSDKASTGVKEKRGDDVDKEPILSPRNSLSLVAGFLLLSSVLSVVIFWQCRSLEQKRTVDERASLVENAFSQPCENALTVQAVGMLFYTPCEPTQCEEQRRQLTSLLESATSCPHPSAMSWRVQAMVFLGAGDDVKAEKALDEALRIDPGNLIGHQLRMKAAEAVVDVDRLRMRKKEALLWFSEEELRLRNWQLERHPLYP
ncbi:MAG: hypothetical protein GY822_00875, partial [Deltaproteobacteria bacterium]|nr:hypothetical protein [Deltaproteobacteria bacterium]